MPDPICQDLVTFNCSRVTSPLCASDNRTYDNFCLFEKAKCSNPSLMMLTLGPCPTPPPVTTTTLSVFELICQSLIATTCPTNQPQVCGSDGNTYDSGCDLEKANCMIPGGVTFANTGPC